MATHPPERIDLEMFVLRRPTDGDADRIAATVADNLAHLAPWMPWASIEAATPAAQQRRLQSVASAWDAGDEYEFVATSPKGDVVIGGFGLHRRVGPGGIELGYWLSKDAVGHGYASGATRALTAAALALDDVRIVEIHCDEANLRSQRVAERAGYRLDRVEPDAVEAPSEVGRSMVWLFPP